MSLYIGNLSPHIHKDELELVFRRFGRCSVRLKDGYGFAVYDFRPNAAKALRALRGRNIFGAPMSLSWSNMQPRPFQRFARGGRRFQAHRRMNSALMNDFVDDGFGSEGHQAYRTSDLEADDDAMRLDSSLVHDEGRSFREHYQGGHHHQGNDLLDEGGAEDPNQVDNDRWGENVDNLSNDVHNENGVTFDRYEPDIGHEFREEEDDNRHMPQFDTRIRHSSPDITRVKEFGDAALDNQLKSSPHRRKRYHSRHQGDYENNSRNGKGEVGTLGSRAWGRLQSNRHFESGRLLRTGKRAANSGTHDSMRRRRNSPIAREMHKDKEKASGGKWHLGRENVTSGGDHNKRVRKWVASAPYSAGNARGSHPVSRSPRSIGDSGSHYRSRSSSSYSSRYKSKSRRSRSASVNSKSKSQSSSHTSLSMSVSLGQPVVSPPNQALVDSAGSLGVATALVTEETMTSGKKDIHRSPSVYLLSKENVHEDGVKVIEGNNETNHVIHGVLSEFRALCPPAFEDEDPVAKEAQMQGKLQLIEAPSGFLVKNDKLVSRESSEIKSVSSPEDIEMEKIQEPPSAPHFRNLDLSLEELYHVLKHYGLQYPEESERCSTAGDHFGAARLWPWEIIYYRKLKKGPISTENYARRLSQNSEYGIIDKYIRSSTGWGELLHDCP